MMNLDERIKQELESEKDKIDSYLVEDMVNVQTRMPTAFGRLLTLGINFMLRWNWAVGLLAGALCLFSSYQFVISTNMQNTKIWGIILVFSIFASIGLKVFTMMDMHRRSIIRELKRIELAIERSQSHTST